MMPRPGDGAGFSLPPYHSRPLWRSLRDGLVFAAVLMLAVFFLDRFGMIDVGTGNARAKDGDSLTLNGLEVRLYGIDAPELDQTCSSNAGEYACGREAREALRDLLKNRSITCKSLETDRYGRAVSICRGAGLEINNEMVRQGWAVAYFSRSTAYARAQKEARAARRGIWRGKFAMPESYRARRRAVGADVLGE